MNLVSCIVPIYNVKDYMRKCVESLIDQTYSNIEIILVDDGSTDGSGLICDDYAKQDNRIKVIHKENGGLSSARNAGIDISKGDFLMFIDGDDYLASETVEYLIQIQENVDVIVDLIQFRYKEVEYDELIKRDKDVHEVKLCMQTEEMFEQLYELGGVAASACTKLYRKNIFDEVRYPEGILHEDEYVITDILAKAKGVLYTDKVLYYYVKRQGSIVHASFNPKKMDVFISIKCRLQYLQKQEWKGLIRKEHYRYYMTLMNMYCDAYQGRYLNECCEIKSQLKNLLEETTIDVQGKMKVFERLCRFNESFVHVYYWLRKIARKI